MPSLTLPSLALPSLALPGRVLPGLFLPSPTLGFNSYTPHDGVLPNYNNFIKSLGTTNVAFSQQTVAPPPPPPLTPYFTMDPLPTPSIRPETAPGIVVCNTSMFKKKPKSKSTLYRHRQNGGPPMNNGKPHAWVKWDIYGGVGVGPWIFCVDHNAHKDQTRVVSERVRVLWKLIEKSDTYTGTVQFPNKTEKDLVARIKNEYASWYSHQLKNHKTSVAHNACASP